MKFIRNSLLALIFIIPLLAWNAPQPAWAWGYGYRFHLGYGHHGHRYHGHKGHHYYKKYRHRHHGYRPYGHLRYRYYGRHGYRGHYRYYNRERYGRSYDERYEGDGTGTNGESYTTTLTDGWDLLKTDRAREALQSFGAAAQANPSNGLPKVGYALSAADLGRLDRGIWAMRRALRIDPKSLHRVNGDAGLQSKVEHLVRRYEYSDFYKTGDEDAYFMLAALNYLLGDYDESEKWIEQTNDSAPSTGNLARLIEQGAVAHHSPGSGVDEGNY